MCVCVCVCVCVRACGCVCVVWERGGVRDKPWLVLYIIPLCVLHFLVLRKRELILFAIHVPICLRSVILTFPGHTHLFNSANVPIIHKHANIELYRHDSTLVFIRHFNHSLYIVMCVCRVVFWPFVFWLNFFCAHCIFF